MNDCIHTKDGQCTKARIVGLRTIRPDGCHGGRCMLLDNRQERCGGYEDRPNMTKELTETLAVLLAHKGCVHGGICHICADAKQTLEEAVGV